MHPKNRPTIIHQSGEKHFQELKAAYKKSDIKADCRAYLDNIEKENEEDPVEVQTEQPGSEQAAALSRETTQ